MPRASSCVFTESRKGGPRTAAGEAQALCSERKVGTIG